MFGSLMFIIIFVHLMNFIWFICHKLYLMLVGPYPFRNELNIETLLKITGTKKREKKRKCIDLKLNTNEWKHFRLNTEFVVPDDWPRLTQFLLVSGLIFVFGFAFIVNCYYGCGECCFGRAFWLCTGAIKNVIATGVRIQQTILGILKRCAKYSLFNSVLQKCVCVFVCNSILVCFLY